MVLNPNSVKEFRTRALGTLFHKMNNDLMTINGFEPSRRVSSLLKGLFRRQRSISFYLAKKKKKLAGLAPPNRFQAICLPLQYGYSKTFRLQGTTYRPPLPSRLLTRYLKPSKSTSGKIYYLLPKSYKLSLLTANIANLVCITLNLKSIIQNNTE